MTKTLTEQWREGTLKEGFYYILFASRFGKDYIAIDMFIPDEKDFMYSSCEDVKEVIAPVPSYDEYKELVRKSDKLDKIMSDAVTNQGDCQQIVEDNLNRQIERLQEQLNEANAILKSYANRDNWSSIMDGCGYSDNALYVDDHGYSSAENYLEKWGVK